MYVYAITGEPTWTPDTAHSANLKKPCHQHTQHALDLHRDLLQRDQARVARHSQRVINLHKRIKTVPSVPPVSMISKLIASFPVLPWTAAFRSSRKMSPRSDW